MFDESDVFMTGDEATKLKYPLYKDSNCITTDCLGWQKYIPEEWMGKAKGVNYGYCKAIYSVNAGK